MSDDVLGMKEWLLWLGDDDDDGPQSASSFITHSPYWLDNFDKFEKA